MTYHMIFNRSNKTGPTNGPGISFTIPIFRGGRVAQSLVLFYDVLVVIACSFFFLWGGGVHFLLAMFHLRFTASYYPFTIVEHLLYLVDNPHLCEKYYNRQLVPLYQMIHEISFQFINIYSISAVKTGLQSYCDTSYFRGDVHQMWILIISKDLLESMSCSTWNSIINI